MYVVRCADGSLYTGSTADVERRVRMHDAGRGAKYTRGRGPVTLVHVRRCRTRTDALKLEYRIKKMSRAAKLSLEGSA